MRYEHDRAVVRVTDSGVGTPTEALTYAFERFYRIKDTHICDVNGGTGADLAVSRANARAHGGDLTAHSDGPSHGTTFALTLPTATS